MQLILEGMEKLAKRLGTPCINTNQKCLKWIPKISNTSFPMFDKRIIFERLKFLLRVITLSCFHSSNILIQRNKYFWPVLFGSQVDWRFLFDKTEAHERLLASLPRWRSIPDLVSAFERVLKEVDGLEDVVVEPV
jgi:hypothetical protein